MFESTDECEKTATYIQKTGLVMTFTKSVIDKNNERKTADGG
jgi:hypothetical protein